MYDPSTLAFSFPPYPSRSKRRLGERAPRERWRTFAEWLYDQSSWIGFDVWHIDPEKPGTGNRRDDSCGWFPRDPGPYASAVKDTLDDKDVMQHIANTVERQVFWRSAYLEQYPEDQRGWKRVTPADALALVLMVGRRLEHIRWWQAYRAAPWWKRPFLRKHKVTDLLIDLALNPGDNLAPSSDGYSDSFVRLIAGALHRHIRPWWRHPRWHVHHWQVNIHLFRNLNRLFFQRCEKCGCSLGWNISLTRLYEGGPLYHSRCAGHMPAAASPGA